MNRDIKFRGMSEKGKWHYGWFFTNEFDESTIFSADGAWKVSLDSVGQFTGIYSKSNREIYEGDIVRAGDDKKIGVVGWGKYITENEWGEDILGWMFVGKTRAWALDPQDGFEIVGNIYENSDLVEI